MYEAEAGAVVDMEDLKYMITNGYSLWTKDYLIEQSCHIRQPIYTERARDLCMRFCRYDQHYEVFTDEEGDFKAINGFPLRQK